MATVRERNGLWQVQIRLKGHRPVSESFPTEKQARSWANRKEAELRNGIIEAAPKDVRQLGSVTFGTVLEKFHEISQLTNSYKAAYRSLLRDPISKLTLREINKRVALEWRNRVLTNMKPSSVSKYARVPRGAWEFAADVLELPVGPNPFNRMGLKDVKTRRWRRLAKGEETKLLTALTHFKKRQGGGPKPSDWEDIIQFAIETGLRRGELVKARVDHLRGSGQKQFLWVPETKTDRPRAIPLTKKAVAILEDRQARGFNDKLFPFQARTLTRDFTFLTRAAGIKDLHFHDLRHEALSRMNEKGLGTHELMMVSGHRTTENLSVYVNPTLERVAEAMWS